MKTVMSLKAVFVFFLLIGFGVGMITPEAVKAEEYPCNSNCSQVGPCRNNLGECIITESPYYECFQPIEQVGCEGPYTCGCKFKYCADLCIQP